MLLAHAGNMPLPCRRLPKARVVGVGLQALRAYLDATIRTARVFHA